MHKGTLRSVKNIFVVAIFTFLLVTRKILNTHFKHTYCILLHKYVFLKKSVACLLATFHIQSFLISYKLCNTVLFIRLVQVWGSRLQSSFEMSYSFCFLFLHHVQFVQCTIPLYTATAVHFFTQNLWKDSCHIKSRISPCFSTT